MRSYHLLIGLALIALAPKSKADSAAQDRLAELRGRLGTYAGAPHLPDGHVDSQLLLSQLKELHANTYSWLIWRTDHDWEDLQAFLPLAAKQQIRVWVTIVPPTESPPRTHHYSEPFKTDYDQWATEIAKLSVKSPNLVAWSIDDFSENPTFFTPKKTHVMIEEARSIDPKLAFVPCVYYRQAFSRHIVDYRDSIDGILFPYRSESSKKMNLSDAAQVRPEIENLHKLLGPDIAVIMDVYSTGHSQIGESTPDYVKQVLINGRGVADGLMIYCHPAVGGEKYEVVRQVFGDHLP